MVRLRLLGTVVVPLHIELLQLLWVADALLDHEAAHHPAGFLGVEADDLVLAVLEVLEVDVDHAGLQGAAFYRAEVLIAGQVQQHEYPMVWIFGMLSIGCCFRCICFERVRREVCEKS